MKLIKYFLIVMIFAACHKADCPAKNNNNGLIGKWQWYKSTEGIANTTSTPQSTGRTWALQLNNDLTCIQTGDLLQNETGTYYLTTENTPLGTKYYLNIIFASETYKLDYYFISTDSIQLNDHIESDGLSHFFVRIQ